MHPLAAHAPMSSVAFGAPKIMSTVIRACLRLHMNICQQQLWLNKAMAMNYIIPHTWDVLYMHGSLYTCMTAGPSSHTKTTFYTSPSKYFKLHHRLRRLLGCSIKQADAPGVATASQLTSAKTSCPSSMLYLNVHSGMLWLTCVSFTLHVHFFLAASALVDVPPCTCAMTSCHGLFLCNVPVYYE